MGLQPCEVKGPWLSAAIVPNAPDRPPVLVLEKLVSKFLLSRPKLAR